MNENQIVTTILLNLEKNARIKGRFQHLIKDVVGFDGQLSFPALKELPRFNVQIKKELRQYQLPRLYEQAGKEHDFMIMAENIFPTIKEELRNNGINYVDAAGNIYIKTAHQIIWIDGNKYIPQKSTNTNKAFTKTGLKTIFYFLTNDDAINFPYREIADATDVALGNIKNIIDGLRQAGYILLLNEKKLKLQNKRSLLERWVTAYGEILKPTLFLGTYDFWDRNQYDNWKKLPIDRDFGVWGGEPGGDLLTHYLKPENLTVYTQERTKLMKRWKLVPKQEGKLHLYQKFWKDDPKDQNVYAPVMLIYADLILTNDPRCNETAMIVYDKYLKDGFE